MTTEHDDFNGIDEPLHELAEEAKVTRAATLGNAFMERFWNDFAAAENSTDKKFLLEASTFDQFLVEQGLMPADIAKDNAIAMAGKTSTRNYYRRTINRVSAFGKGVWPPFSIDPLPGNAGVAYEVSLLEYYADKLPAAITKKAMTYIVNKGTYWGQLSAYMHSEAVQKRLAEKGASEVRTRFISAEQLVRVTFKNVAGQLENLNEAMHESYREARRIMALPPQ